MRDFFSSPAIRGSRFYFAFYGALAVWIPFLNVYFRGLGLSGWQIGLLSALLPGATFLLAAPLTALADRRGWHIPMLALAALGLGLALLLLVAPTHFWLLLLIMILLAVFFSPLTPLADSTVVGMAARHNLNFGGMRLWGSFSFALVAVASGTVWQRSGYRPMFVLSAVLYATVAWYARSLDETVAPERHQRVPLGAFRHDRFLIVMLLSTFLISSALGMDLTFSGIYMTHLGGSGLFVGMIFGFSALFELPTMHYSDRIAAFLGGPACLLIAYVLFGVAYLGYALSPAPVVMLGFSIFRGLAYGLFYASTIRLLSRRAPPQWSSTLQGVMNSLAFGLAQLLSRPLSGVIYDTLGPASVYLACTVAVAVAILLMGGLLGLQRPSVRVLDDPVQQLVEVDVPRGAAGPADLRE